MSRIITFISLFIFLITLSSCDLVSKSDSIVTLPEHGYVESSYFIYDTERTVYRNLDYVIVYPEENADTENLADLFDEYRLQLVTLFDHHPVKQNQGIYMQTRGAIALRITTFQFTAEDYYSYSTTEETEAFRTHPGIAYAFPVYSHNNDGSHVFYPMNSISVKYPDGRPLPEALKAAYHLEFRSVLELIDTYRYRIKSFEHGSPVDVARLLFLEDEFEYVTPGRIDQIIRH